MMGRREFPRSRYSLPDLLGAGGSDPGSRRAGTTGLLKPEAATFAGSPDAEAAREIEGTSERRSPPPGRSVDDVMFVRILQPR
jgi:hypothetical protein